MVPYHGNENIDVGGSNGPPDKTDIDKSAIE
jgi:hypothetical protein